MTNTIRYAPEEHLLVLDSLERKRVLLFHNFGICIINTLQDPNQTDSIIHLKMPVVLTYFNNSLHKGWNIAVVFCFNFVRIRWKKRVKSTGWKNPVILRLKTCHTVFFNYGSLQYLWVKAPWERRETMHKSQSFTYPILPYKAIQHLGKDLISAYQIPGNTDN